MGYSLDAGHMRDGTPWLAIGTPGEGMEGYKDVGNVHYLQGDRPAVAISQKKTGIDGNSENGDRFGIALAGNSHHLVIGSPHEALHGATDTGWVHVFSHELDSNGVPDQVAFISQETEGVTGTSEVGDELGAAIDIVDYRPDGAPDATDSIVVIGAPGEKLRASNGTDRAGAGSVLTFHITGRGAWSQFDAIGQDTAGVSGEPEADDRFGENVAIASTDPADASIGTMVRAIGVPGETLSGATESGLVQVFSGFQDPTATEVWLVPGNAGLPGTPGADQRFGSVLTATGAGLYVGMPFGPTAYGAVHTIPWSNLTGGTTQPVTTYAPGSGGIPAGGSTFGSAVR